MTRHDITPEQVARMWLAGMPNLAIAEELGVSPGLVQRRLAEARATLPHLPWADRTPPRGEASTVAFRDMNDGVEGGREPGRASLVRGHQLARRR